MSFLDRNVFADKYQRNNKQTGVKNLRCFPTCAAEGHQSNGFCGRAVRIQLEQDAHLVLAEFTQLATKSIFTVGQKLAVRDLRQYHGLMVAKHPVASTADVDEDWTIETISEAVEGCRSEETAEGQPRVLELRVKRGWHYDWVSNRHTCMNLHCLRTYMFQIINQGQNVVCVKILDSPSFQVYSRRRSLKSLPSPRRAAMKRPLSSSQKNAGSEDQGGSDDLSESVDGDESSEEKQDEIILQQQHPRLGEASIHARSSSSFSQHLQPVHSSSSSAPLPAISGLAINAHTLSDSLQHPLPIPSSTHTQLNMSLLSQLFESLEVFDSDALRVEAAVSPFVFAKAVQSLDPLQFDQASYDVMLRLKMEKPTLIPKRTVCAGMTIQLTSSYRLTAALSSAVMMQETTASPAELITSFLLVAQHTLYEYAGAINANPGQLLELFQTNARAPGIFRPLFPYGQ